MKSRIGLCATVLSGALAVSGCGGDPEPEVADPAPSASTSAPTSSPTTSPTATESADSERAYRDFIESCVDAISRSLSTGDPSEWLAMSSPECEGCAGLADQLRQAYTGGGRIEDASWVLKTTNFRDTTTLGAVWDVSVRRTEEHWFDASGAPTQTVEAGVIRFGFAIAEANRELAVREIQRL